MYIRLLIIFVLTISTFGCSDFKYPVEDGSIFSARTMDFMIPQGAQMVLIPAGSPYSSDGGISWITDVNYLSITAYGYNKTVDGLNQCGMSCALLTLIETEYQTVSNGYEGLGMSCICDWVLGQYCAVQDVQTNLLKLKVFADKLVGNVPIPLLHVSLHDENGNSLVIEFIKGEQVYHDNLVGILTNDPTYDWHMKNIQNYNYINNVSPLGNITINSFTFDAAYPGYATANFGISSDDGPVSRFVRLSQYIRYLDVPKNEKQAVTTGYHLLEKVSVVPGFSKMLLNGKLITDVTIYRIIRDHTNKRFYFTTYNDLTLKMVDVSVDVSRRTEGHHFLENLHPANVINITKTLL